jgi:Fe2+ or Zn2+ uptake regulation protein
MPERLIGVAIEVHVGRTFYVQLCPSCYQACCLPLVDLAAVEWLYDAARAEMPSISLKTVYQTVHDLEAMGEVALLDVGTGSIRVDPNVEDRHHHLVCTGCGTVRDVLVDVADLRVPPRVRQTFAVQSVEVIFRGVCEACAPGDPEATGVHPTVPNRSR